MAAAANNGFDGRMFAKLVGLLDSPQEAEATGALRRMRVLAQKNGMAVYEAVETHDYKTAIWQNFGEPECLREYFEKHGTGDQSKELREEIARLQGEIERQKKLVEKAECDGGKLAEALTQEQKVSEGLREERAQLSEKMAALRGRMAFAVFAPPQSADPELCWPCEIKRRWLAAIAGLLSCLAWMAMERKTWAEWLRALGFMGALAGPFLGVYWRWRWLLFKREHSWVSLTDNDIWRDLWMRWQRFKKWIWQW